MEQTPYSELLQLHHMKEDHPEEYRTMLIKIKEIMKDMMRISKEVADSIMDEDEKRPFGEFKEDAEKEADELA